MIQKEFGYKADVLTVELKREKENKQTNTNKQYLELQVFIPIKSSININMLRKIVLIRPNFSLCKVIIYHAFHPVTHFLNFSWDKKIAFDPSKISANLSTLYHMYHGYNL